jgi:hypothetical protein
MFQHALEFPEVYTLQLLIVGLCMQPATVREFVDKVTNTPFDALPGVLEGFTWHFEKVRH